MENLQLENVFWRPQHGMLPHENLREGHAAQERLCDQLKMFSDLLPSGIDRIRYFKLAHNLRPVISSIHAFEQGLAARNCVGMRSPGLKTLEMLKTGHFMVECYADEVGEKLLHLGCSRRDEDVEAMGNLLRLFLACMRKQIAFEQEFFGEILEVPA